VGGTLQRVGQMAPLVLGGEGTIAQKVLSLLGSAGAGEAASQTAQALGAGPGVQTAADILGSTVGGAKGFKLGEGRTVKPAYSAGPGAEAQRAADRQGIKISPTLTSPTAAGIASTVRGTPGAAPIAAAEAQSAKNLADAVTAHAASYGPIDADAVETGEKIQKGAAAWIDDSGKEIGDKYNLAEGLVGNTRVEPTKLSNAFDTVLYDLGQNPAQQKPVIDAVNKIKSDALNEDIPLTVARARALRSTMYQTLGAQDLGLTGTAKSAIIDQLYGALSNDVKDTLTAKAAVPPGATWQQQRNAAQYAQGSQLYNEADVAWQDRAMKVKAVMAKVLGKNANDILETDGPGQWGADMPPEAAANAVAQFAQGKDHRAVVTLMDNLDGDGQRAVRSSLINMLGKDDQGNFDANKFLTNLNSLTPRTQLAVFGKDGVQTLQDFRSIADVIANPLAKRSITKTVGAEAIPAAVGTALGATTLGPGGAVLGGILGAAVTPTANRITANMLTSPGLSRRISQYVNAPTSAARQTALQALVRYGVQNPSVQADINNFINPPAAAPSAAPGAEPTAPPIDFDKMSPEELQKYLSTPKAAPTSSASSVPTPGVIDFDNMSVDELRKRAGLPPETAKPAQSGAPVTPPADNADLHARVKYVESHGDPAAISPKGAEGAMQVMRKTQYNPGFGVTPAKDHSAVELERVGNDYLDAMLTHYGDPKLALMAYNWGPGNVDNWLAGKAKSVPAETRAYVKKILGVEV
jgi:hypothetical protein